VFLNLWGVSALTTAMSAGPTSISAVKRAVSDRTIQVSGWSACAGFVVGEEERDARAVRLALECHRAARAGLQFAGSDDSVVLVHAPQRALLSSRVAMMEAHAKPRTIATQSGPNLPSGSPPRLGHALSPRTTTPISAQPTAHPRSPERE
jgi:hypothetical protein